MNHPINIPLCESLDAFTWDPDEIRDLVRTTPIRSERDGYDADQLFGMEPAHDE